MTLLNDDPAELAVSAGLRMNVSHALARHPQRLLAVFMPKYGHVHRNHVKAITHSIVMLCDPFRACSQSVGRGW